MRSINRVGNLLERVGVPWAALSPGSVERVARRRVRDLRPDPGAHLPLRLICDDYASGPPLSLIGRSVALKLLARTLVNRHRIAEFKRKNPESCREHLKRPIVVVGLPRTGTTQLLNLLAAAPSARPLQVWESMEPVGPAVGAGAPSDPRRRAAASVFGLLHYAAPDMASIHAFESDGPEECTGLLFNTFRNPFFRGDLPSYRRWLFSQSSEDMDAAYRLYADQLAICQYQRPGPTSGHWVLKSPSHTFALDSLLRVLPDAVVVQMHRAPETSLASLCSLTAAFDRITYEQVDRARIGARTLEIVSELLRRSLRVEGGDFAGRIHHVAYRDLIADPVGTVASIHDRAGLEFDAETRAAVVAESLHRERSRAQAHVYRLDDFGLDERAVARQFSDYRDRFATLIG